MILTTSALDTALLPILSGINSNTALFARMYGRCRVEMVKGVDKLKSIEKDRPRRLPMVWDDNLHSNVPVVPDVHKGGLLFFITTAPTKVIDSEPGWALTSGTQTKEYSLALLGWWDSRHEAGYPDVVLEQLEEQLGKSFNWQTSTIDDQLATRVFRDLDYDFDNHPYLLHPFTGIRIEGTLTLTETLCTY